MVYVQVAAPAVLGNVTPCPEAGDRVKAVLESTEATVPAPVPVAKHAEVALYTTVDAPEHMPDVQVVPVLTVTTPAVTVPVTVVEAVQTPSVGYEPAGTGRQADMPVLGA